MSKLHACMLMILLQTSAVFAAEGPASTDKKPERQDLFSYMYKPENMRSRGPGKAPDFIGANAPAETGVEAQLRVLGVGKDKNSGRTLLICKESGNTFDVSMHVLVEAPVTDDSEIRKLIEKEVFFVLTPSGSITISTAKVESVTAPYFRVAEVCDNGAFETCRTLKK